MNIYEFRLIFHYSFFPKGQIKNIPAFDDNGLALTRQQAIIWTN